MIVSVSRRTDVPAFYTAWFFNRLKEKEVCVRNPRNPNQCSLIALNPGVVDCLVFWTKNPAPMLERLDELEGFDYYFQFTLNPYERDIEPGFPAKSVVIDTFKRLSERIGKERIIWRYDPVLLTDKYTEDYHQEQFTRMATQLKDHTVKCVISFVDHYRHGKRRLEELGIYPVSDEVKRTIARSFADVARQCGLELSACAEELALTDWDITPASCIDPALIGRLTGHPFAARKDKNQRLTCQCIESIDIGAYNTCKHGCVYCYANTNPGIVQHNALLHDPVSSFLVGQACPLDKISCKELKSLKLIPRPLF